jgi:hypothetical protein
MIAGGGMARAAGLLQQKKGAGKLPAPLTIVKMR